MNSMPSQRRVNVMYTLLQICYWGMLAAFCGYQTAIVLDRGFSSSAAGIFISLGCVAGIFTQPLLGGWADRNPGIPLKRIFAGCMALAMAVQAVFYFTRPGFAGTAVIFLALGVLETNAYPLIDAMAMQYLNTGMDIRYSLGRGLGSLSYAAVCILLGQQTQRFGVESALVTHAVLMLCILAAALAYPAFPREPPRSGEEERPGARPPEPHSALYLLRSSKPFALMLLGGFFGMMAVMPVGNFMVNLIRSRSGDNADLGTAMFLMAASELPAALLFQKLWKRLGSERVLLISLVFMMVKPLACFAARRLMPLLLVQPVQMLGYGLFTPGNVYFANENVAPEDRVRGQTVKMVATNGMGGVAGNLLAGFVIDRAGLNAMLLILGALGALGVCFGALAVRARAHQTTARA